jgi:mono/diheme cytochrome c family protein
MRKITTIAFFSLIVFACSRKTIATTETKTNTETVAPVKPVAETHDPATPAMAATTEMLAAGKTVYINRCGRCHELNPVEKFTAQRWEGILKSMIPKAKLNDGEAAQVTAYVRANAKK